MSTANVTLVKPQNRFAKSYLKAFDGSEKKGLGYDVTNLSSIQQWGIKLGFAGSKKDFINDYDNYNKLNRRGLVFWMMEGNDCLAEVSFAPREVGFLKGHAEPQEACNNLFGLKGDYVVIPTIKMSPKAKTKENFKNAFVKTVEKLKEYKVGQFLVNAPIKNKGLNRYFSTICKFCKGKALKTKNTIEYLLPPNVEKVKEAFNELAMIAAIKAKDGINGVLTGLKEMATAKKTQIENSSLLKTIRDKLKNFGEKGQKSDNVKVYALGYNNAGDVMAERRHLGLEMRRARMGR